MDASAQYWIKQLDLEKHPEGGYFREIYRSDETLNHHCLPERYNFAHTFATSIYFLIPEGEHSAFHRLQGDETWHLYDGGPVTLYIINPDGELITKTLGHDLEAGQAPQVIVKRNQWFAAVAEHDSYALVGCVMAPGFEFDDLELGNEQDLVEKYPQHEALIKQYSAETVQ